MMVQRLSQVVTQAIDRHHLLVHELPRLGRRQGRLHPSLDGRSAWMPCQSFHGLAASHLHGE